MSDEKVPFGVAANGSGQRMQIAGPRQNWTMAHEPASAGKCTHDDQVEENRMAMPVKSQDPHTEPTDAFEESPGQHVRGAGLNER